VSWFTRICVIQNTVSVYISKANIPVEVV